MVRIFFYNRTVYTGTPEEDLLAWLDREEENVGLADIEAGLQDIDIARRMFYDELGYDMTEAQFIGLKTALDLRYAEFPAVSVSYTRVEQAWGYQPVYRDVVTGRFVSKENVEAAVSYLRGL